MEKRNNEGDENDMILNNPEICCKNCPHCDIVTDDDYCKRMKCKATKRGKTITWSMCILGENVLQYFADHVEKHTHPKWCPRVKETEQTRG